MEEMLCPRWPSVCIGLVYDDVCARGEGMAGVVVMMGGTSAGFRYLARTFLGCSCTGLVTLSARADKGSALADLLNNPSIDFLALLECLVSRNDPERELLSESSSIAELMGQVNV